MRYKAGRQQEVGDYKPWKRYRTDEKASHTKTTRDVKSKYI